MVPISLRNCEVLLQWRHMRVLSSPQRLVQTNDREKVPHYWPFVREPPVTDGFGIHRWPKDSPHKGPVKRRNRFTATTFTPYSLGNSRIGETSHAIDSLISGLVRSVLDFLWVPFTQLGHWLEYLNTQSDGRFCEMSVILNDGISLKKVLKPLIARATSKKTCLDCS